MLLKIRELFAIVNAALLWLARAAISETAAERGGALWRAGGRCAGEREAALPSGRPLDPKSPWKMLVDLSVWRSRLLAATKCPYQVNIKAANPSLPRTWVCNANEQVRFKEFFPPYFCDCSWKNLKIETEIRQHPSQNPNLGFLTPNIWWIWMPSFACGF